MRKIIVSILLGLVVFFSLSAKIYAAAPPPPPGSQCGGVNQSCCTGAYVKCNAGLTCTGGVCINTNPAPPSINCNGTSGVSTAIGCIDVLSNQETFLGEILRWAVGIGGGIAFLLIVYAGFMIMTGAGNPERLKAGQELMTSAISGLILLIFAIFMLRFIGIDILGLNQLGFSTQ